MNQQHIELIKQELGLKQSQVINTLNLFSQGCTIPFISRYRKEATDGLDEVEIAKIRDRHEQLVELDKRRLAVISSIEEQGLLTDELKNKLLAAHTLTDVEDIYLPYKPKKKTKATIAKAKGLEPLAKIIMSQNAGDIVSKALQFVNNSTVLTVEEALSGARDIIAEWISESQLARNILRQQFEKYGTIKSIIVKDKEEEGEKYKTYFNWNEALYKAPSHRILAMFRGEEEGFLKLKIAPDEEPTIEKINRIFIKSNNESSEQIGISIKDSYKRLLLPSIETEVRKQLKAKADEKAIAVFSENLRQLLLAPPLGQKNILAIDPGFRTGCKIVCLDKHGKLLHNETIYPHPPKSEQKQAMNKIEGLISAYNIEAIAIGNGTAGRETEALIKKMRFNKDIIAVMVNENGASVYSASAVAREEFPDYDVTVRGSVSIGRRLMDPLSELVKIDAKSIGVGQYQHDVDQKELHKSLDDVVISCVNSVGVELNTASKQLLSYVSGVGETLAKNIIDYRNEHGAFKSREGLKKVKRFGDKVFEQAAGFIRIQNAENPLDNSAVHPERYKIVQQMAKDENCTIKELIENPAKRKNIRLEKYITNEVGLPTLTDILKELEKPGRDPRSEITMFTFDRNINNISDLEVGKKYPGIITNITAFGAFVDIGVHQDGLLHISNLANEFISDPNEVVKLNQQVIVKVLEVDAARKRINLSMKE